MANIPDPLDPRRRPGAPLSQAQLLNEFPGFNAAHFAGRPANLRVTNGTLRAVISQESQGRQFNDDGNVLTSSAGAMGLMQLMPKTAATLGVDPTDPKQNVEGGTRLLQTLLDKYGNWSDALMAYNRGEPKHNAWVKAGRNPDELPEETRNYVRIILPQIERAIEDAAAPLIQKQGEDTPGDQAAEIKKLAIQTGLPVDTVRRNFAKVKARANLKKIAVALPVTRKTIARPEVSPIAHDLGEEMGKFEKTANSIVPLGSIAGSGDIGIGQRFFDALVQAPGSELVRFFGAVPSGLADLNDVAIRSIARGLNAIGLEAVTDLLQADLGLPELATPSGVLRGFGEPVKQAAQAIGLSPERQTVITDITGALAQLTAQVGVGLLFGGTSQLVILAGQGADIIAEDARQKPGANQADVDAAIVSGAAITVITERIGLDLLLNRIPPQIRNRVFRWLADVMIGGGIEAVQEAVEGLAHDLVELVTFDPKKQVGQGLSREAIAAGGAGAIFRALLGLRGQPTDRVRDATITKEQMDDLQRQATESTLRQRDEDAGDQFHADVFADAGIETVTANPAKVREWAVAQEGDTDAALAALGTTAEEITAAIAAAQTIDIAGKPFYQEVLLSDTYSILANDIAFQGGQETVAESIAPIAELVDDVGEGLKSRVEDEITPLPENLAEQMEEVLAEVRLRDVEKTAKAIKNAPADVKVLLNELMAEAVHQRITTEEEIIRGRFDELDAEIARLEAQTVEAEAALEEATTEGRGTINLAKKLDKLEQQLKEANDEQAALPAPSGDTFFGATSDVLRPAVPAEVKEEEEALQEQLRSLQQKKIDEVAALERAEAQVITEPESVGKAALRFRKEVFTGQTHADALEVMKEATGIDDLSVDTFAEIEQGFVTSTGRFVSREEATQVARAAKQIGETSRPLDSFTPLTQVEQETTIEDLQPDTITNILGRDDIAFIEAATKENTPSENVERLSDLKAFLDEQGIEYVETKGRFDGVANEGVAIFASSGVVEDIANRYGQEAILTGEGLIFSDSSDKITPATEVIPVDESFKGDMTFIPSTGARFRMTFGKERARGGQAAVKNVVERVKRRQLNVNKQIAEAEEQLLAIQARFALKPAARQRKLLLRARVLDALEVKTTRQMIQVLRKGFRKGVKAGVDQLVDLQKQAAQAIKDAGLTGKRQIRMLKQIRQAKTAQALATIKVRILVQVEKQRRDEIRTGIKKILKRTKSSGKGLRTIGKVGDPNAQAMLDAAREVFTTSKTEASAALEDASVIAEAQAKLEAAVGTLAPDIEQSFINSMYAIAAKTDDLSTQEMEDILIMLEEIESTGKAIGKLKALDRRRRRNSDVAEASTAALTDFFGNVEDPNAGSTTDLVARARRFYRNAQVTLASSYNTLDEILNIVFDKRGVDVKDLLGRLRVTHVAQQVKKRTLRLQAEYQKIGIDIFRLKNEGQLLDRYHVDSVRSEIGGEGHQWINQNGKPVTLEYSVAEARKLWQEWQDPTLREAITNTNEDVTEGQVRGNAYTDEMRNAIFGILSDTDKAYARAEMQFIKDMYADINTVYRNLMGINLPFNEFYTPITRDLQAATDEGGAGTSILETIATEQQYRRQLPAATRKRVGNLHPLKRRSDLGSTWRYIQEMSHFIETAEHMAHMRAVFADPTLRTAIVKHHGQAMLNQFDGMIHDLSAGYPQRGADIEQIFNAFSRGFVPFTLGFKLVTGAKQLTSHMAMSENVPPGVFAKISFRMLVDPKFALRMVKLLHKDSGLMQKRDASPELAIAAMGADLDPVFRSNLLRRGRLAMTQVGFAAIRLGDRMPIYIGGAAVYTHAITSKSKGGLGKTHNEAIVIFEDAVASTQQSADLDKQSALTRSGPLGRMLTLFMSARFALLRGQLRFYRQMARGKLTPTEIGQRFFTYHVVMPGLIQWIANGFQWDDEDQLVALFFGQLNALWLIGETITYGAVQILSDNPNKARRGKGFIPLFEFVNEIGEGVVKAARGDIDFEEATDLMLEIVGIMAHINLPQLKNIAAATADVLSGEAEIEAIYKAFGLGSKAAAEATLRAEAIDFL